MNNNINTLLNSLSNLGEIRKADKNIGEYSSESDFTMTVGTKRRIYNYFPKNKEQLQEIIAEKIYNEGNINYECDLNDIDIRGVGDDLSRLFYNDSFAIGGTFWEFKQNKIKIKYFNGHIEDWDVSNVENMKDMFACCKWFNQDISGWDVSNVKDMSGMFKQCSSFDQDISDWKVHNVKDMELMFCGCEKFNQNISRWNVSNVENMMAMFSYCTKFDQNLLGWDVSNVKYWGNIFESCAIKDKHKPFKFRK